MKQKVMVYTNFLNSSVPFFAPSLPFFVPPRFPLPFLHFLTSSPSLPPLPRSGPLNPARGPAGALYSTPSGVRGRAPAIKAFSVYYKPKKRVWWQQFLLFLCGWKIHLIKKICNAFCLFFKICHPSLICHCRQLPSQPTANSATTVCKLWDQTSIPISSSFPFPSRLGSGLLFKERLGVSPK